MKRLKKIAERLYRSSWLKYALVTILAVVFIGFVDENSVWNHFKNQQQIGELQDEINRQTSQYNRDRQKIKMLDSNPKAIEKIARERYFMKEDNEDIFVFSEDQPQSAPAHETVE
ncbi:MAG: septum formation initiator family protein [Prevotella sp.]|nr:septum formation initiator family protein [Prevotella sp.]